MMMSFKSQYAGTSGFLKYFVTLKFTKPGFSALLLLLFLLLMERLITYYFHLPVASP